MLFSIIVPVYNRSQEIYELLESLSKQVYSNFDITIVEDGTTDSCKHVIDSYSDKLSIHYYFKENTSVSFRRNFAMSVAKGDYFVFFDSDCIIPPNYFNIVSDAITSDNLEAWGGPDNAHSSFNNFQKAINYSMTSFLTTGGIRGGKKKLDKYYPRSFNMGISSEVFKVINGFPTGIQPGEDIIFSIKVINAKFKTRLISDAFVYHKRKINIKKYFKQINSFAKVRVAISLVYPHTASPVFMIPSIYISGFGLLVLLSIFVNPLFLLPLAIHYIAIFVDSFIKNSSIPVAALSVVSSIVQFFAYGTGYLSASIKSLLMGKNKFLESINYLQLLK